MALELISKNRCFAGEQRRYEAASNELSSTTIVSIFVPDFAVANPVPVLFYLSGLTCTDENAVTKAGAQRIASELGIALVFPDTLSLIHI